MIYLLILISINNGIIHKKHLIVKSPEDCIIKMHNIKKSNLNKKIYGYCEGMNLDLMEKLYEKK